MKNLNHKSGNNKGGRSVINLFGPHCLAMLALLYFILQPLCTSAQLRLLPLQQKQSMISTPPTARPLSVDDTLSLPFLDDFSMQPSDSNGTPKPLADTEKWKNSATVWINNGMGINEPSKNVATLDGLDSLFAPYETQQILVNGFTDKLESKPINLEEVEEDQRTSVYLSFFYQWQGNGEAPDPQDYLQLEFLNRDTVWVEIRRFYPGDTPDNTTFIYVHEKVDSAAQQKFYHKGFQFRIKRFGRKSGPFDTWNIDYVYLNSGRSASTQVNFPDLAMIGQISPLFKPYRSVPARHFFETKHVDSVRFVASNLRNLLASATYRATATYTNYYENSTSSKSEVLVNFGDIGDAVLFPVSRKTGKLLVLPDVDNTDNFDPAANSIRMHLTIEVSDTASFITTNDTISADFNIADYYAYDDGIADNSIILTQPGNAAAVQFNMITSEPDTLLAFDIYFPAHSVENNQTVDLAVYNDNGGKPGAILARRNPYSIPRRGLNKFARIAINPIRISGLFYIGWTEPSFGNVKIGFDFSNDIGDKIFVKVGSAWSQNTDIHGAPMIRPVFGSGNVVTGIEKQNHFVAYYPNPSNGTFYIQGRYDQLNIINATGQIVSYETESEGDRNKITLQQTPGLYLIQIRKGNAEKTGKLIILNK